MLLEAGVGNHVNQFQAVRMRSGKGRPRVVIQQEKIEFLRELKFSWTEIASIFSVCRRTLYSVRLEYGILEKFNDQTLVKNLSENL